MMFYCSGFVPKENKPMETINLAGQWHYTTDTNETGLFTLPGSTCDNKIGTKQNYYTELTAETVRAPREKYEYIGTILLEREFEIPQEWENKYITLFLERVNISSELFIDGKQIDRKIIELSVPHIYRLDIAPGRHTMAIRIDNRNLLNIDTMASGYSIDTQGFWCGIIGRIELQCENVYHLENIQVYTKEKGIDIKLTTASDFYSPVCFGAADAPEEVSIEAEVTAPDGKSLGTKIFDVSIFTSRQVSHLSYEINDICFWDEFYPHLYTLNVRLIHNLSTTDEKSVRFGMRTVKSENKEFFINGKSMSLRGTIDCAQNMLTGYPPVDIEHWRRNFRTVKAYGLNHVRFHAWCPPEAAFCAADELGVYISVEMPLWLNKDVTALEFGDDSIHKYYFHNEATAISKVYGNHPSFIMFSNGNEILGDFELLEDITTQIKAYDPRRLYTLTSNFDHPVVPCEDYLCSFDAYRNKVRLQLLPKETAESTCYDYSKAVNDVPVPIVSFEVGQYCVYPNVDICKKFTGTMLPVNFDVIKQFMIKKGVYSRLNDYIQASGDLAKKFYKEDIEAAMRTKKFGGFQLLSLTDYTGQCTATVGMLDVFYDSKGITTPEEFSSFAGSVVPLWKSKRIFTNTEILNAELDLYDYGEKRIEKPIYKVVIKNGESVFFETETTESSVSVPLNTIEKAAMLKVYVTVSGYTNSWTIFVMTDSEPECSVPVLNAASDELKHIIANGGKAIVTAEGLKKPIDGSFEPVFWSPAYFPSHKTCGMMIDNAHPVFNSFPTEHYTDFQWRTPITASKGADMSEFPKEFRPIIEPVPNFFDNTPRSPLFEAKIGKADILFCGFDFDKQDCASKQLKTSIFEYASSDSFKPAQMLDEKVFWGLF